VGGRRQVRDRTVGLVVRIQLDAELVSSAYQKARTFLSFRTSQPSITWKRAWNHAACKSYRGLNLGGICHFLRTVQTSIGLFCHLSLFCIPELCWVWRFNSCWCNRDVPRWDSSCYTFVSWNSELETRTSKYTRLFFPNSLSEKWKVKVQHVLYRCLSWILRMVKGFV